MSSHLVLSAIGPDQVGLVQKISAFIAEQQANIEDSKMAVFSGEFAIIMLLSGNPEKLQGLVAAQSELSARTSLHIFFRTPSEKPYERPMLPCKLVASSLDHPGIVLRLTSELSEAGINIDSMETKTYSAPWSGTPMFRFEANLSVPESVNLARLRAQFSALGEQENFDIELTVVTA
ncbi:MAG: glycine cleavage system protein R [Blastocatellia bacterium]|nr:glycine cleavage system protein R [Blastocatellia bacterium]